MTYLIIERTRHGWRIKNDATGDTIHYINSTLRDAERYFRDRYNLRYKHFIKIFI